MPAQRHFMVVPGTERPNYPRPALIPALAPPDQQALEQISEAPCFQRVQTFRAIEKQVCEAYDLRPGVLWAKEGETRAVYRARHEIFYRARTETTYSLPQIAQRCGGVAHTTVLYGYRQVKTKIELGQFRCASKAQDNSPNQPKPAL